MGSRRFSKYTFTFRHGPGVVPNTVPADVEYLVLVLNGRTDEKVRSDGILGLILFLIGDLERGDCCGYYAPMSRAAESDSTMESDSIGVDCIVCSRSWSRQHFADSDSNPEWHH